MSAPAWADLEALFHKALARAPAERAAFLAERCIGRPDLQAEVEALLHAHDAAASALEVPSVTPQTRLKAGVRLGPYEVLAQLGAGGMGEIYRARDTKLGRDVALKVLPTSFLSDPERLARFEREARVLATLNHPHIGAIYGLEESDGVRALVLELVEGPTLADRLAKAPIPVTEALEIARQIAEALETAHEHGIIHRDLKPANIKIMPDGVVKVLDFGLAKLAPLTRPSPSLSSERLRPARGAESPSPRERGWGPASIEEGGEGWGEGNALPQSPTITVGGTREGVILGTAAYMSPEQARGQSVDKRADIWAFGCVLYEMLTARAAFPGNTTSDTIAAILEREPDWSALPGSTPMRVRDLLQQCLRKDPRRRVHDIADTRIEIDETLTAPPADTPRAGSSTIVRPTLQSRRIAAFAVVALVAGSLVGIAVWLATRPIPPLPRVSRFTITPPSTAALTLNGVDRDLAITPDGTHVVYAGANGSALFVRALDQLDATRLTGLGAPHGPFLSPDGQWIGFVDGQATLKKVALTGGPAVLLGRLDGAPRGATWGPDDTIIFATANTATGLQQMPAAGGEPMVLTRPNRAGGEADHFWPEFLPDGQAVLFTITATTGGLDAASVAVLDLRTGAQTILIRGGSQAHYVRSGHLVYGAAGTLRAVPFDLAARAVVGPPVPVVSPVVTTPYGGVDAVVADDGTLVYVPGSVAATERTLVWVDRQGREQPITARPRAYVYPRLSPDGTRLAVSIFDQEIDVWLWDLARATLTRVTFDPGQDTYPVWTPDSRRLLFRSERAGPRNLFWQAADGTGAIERLIESPNVQNPTAVSPDGARLVFTEIAPKIAPRTGDDVMTVPLSGRRQAEPPGRSSTSAPRLAEGGVSPSNHEVQPLIQTPFTERNGEVSPDGRWLAYEANDSGRAEIYVRLFPDVTSGRWQISTGGGTRPLWARSGQELFYLAPMGALMRVGVERGPAWTATAPVQLLEARYFAGTGGFSGRTYDVSPDGRRFLMIKPGGTSDSTAAPTSLVVVQNWVEELKRLVSVR